MTKRAWWLVGLNVLIPGSAQVLAGNRRLGRFGLGATLVLWVLLVLAGVLYLVRPHLPDRAAHQHRSCSGCSCSARCSTPCSGSS